MTQSIARLTGFLLVFFSAFAQTPEPPPKLTADQLAAQIRGRDLAADPLHVQESSFQLLGNPLPAGNAIMNLRFHRLEQATPRKLAIALDRVEQQAWLRDDGVFPDTQASDGLYRAVIPVDLAQLLQRRLKAERAQLLRNGFARVSPFEGRRKLKPRDFLVPGPLDLMPGRNVPFGGFGFAALVPQRSLIATHASVAGDLNRTYSPCPAPTGNPNGKWTFKYLMQQMANTPVTGVTAEQLTRAWVDTFGIGQPVNGQFVAARPRLKQFILDPWIAASGGPLAPLNLDLAPFELIGIVNRVDLRNNSLYGGRGTIGELRFVFSVLEPGTCNREGFRVIFEYGVPGTGCSAAKNWAQQWANLPVMPSPAYNAALEAITEQVVVAGAVPLKPGGSALNQLRTNERYEGMAPEDDDWQLREYKLKSLPGLHLESATVVRTPAGSYNVADKLLLRDYINNNEANFLLERQNIPLTYPAPPPDKPFRGAQALNFIFFFWDPTGVFNGEARHKFALNTCNGCHTKSETDADFVHMSAGGVLSGFMTGVTVADPVDGTLRDFNDLERRAADMEELLGTSCVLGAAKFTVKGPH
jgi:hypothetical protein